MSFMKWEADFEIMSHNTGPGPYEMDKIAPGSPATLVHGKHLLNRSLSQGLPLG